MNTTTSHNIADIARLESPGMSLTRVLTNALSPEPEPGFQRHMAIMGILHSIAALEKELRDESLTPDERLFVFEAMNRLDAIFNGGRHG